MLQELAYYQQTFHLQMQEFFGWSEFSAGFFPQNKITHNKKKLRGFSPPANYTDRATAACQ
jgi:hypothetical protein